MWRGGRTERIEFAHRARRSARRSTVSPFSISRDVSSSRFRTGRTTSCARRRSFSLLFLYAFLLLLLPLAISMICLFWLLSLINILDLFSSRISPLLITKINKKADLKTLIINIFGSLYWKYFGIDFSYVVLCRWSLLFEMEIFSFSRNSGTSQKFNTSKYSRALFIFSILYLIFLYLILEMCIRTYSLQILFFRLPIYIVYFSINMAYSFENEYYFISFHR